MRFSTVAMAFGGLILLNALVILALRRIARAFPRRERGKPTATPETTPTPPPPSSNKPQLRVISSRVEKSP